MSWDYGLGDQMAMELQAALVDDGAAWCHLCLIRKPLEKNKPCIKCQEEIDDARNVSGLI